MKITSKSRYALKLMLDVIMCSDESEQLVRRQDVATRQGIPLEYLDQILLRLREKNILASVRGRNGGYRLAKPATEISAWDIFSAVEDQWSPVSCLDASHSSCEFVSSCISVDAWSIIVGKINDSLSKVFLSEICSDDKFIEKFQHNSNLSAETKNYPQRCS